MRTIPLIAVFFACIARLEAQTKYSPDIEEQIKKVENSLAGRIKIDGKGYNILERMAFFKLKGLSIAVVQNYKLVWAKGYGWADEKEKRVVTTATLFKPGSISKSLNAVAVLKLTQDKKLSLTKDINEYLQTWKFPYDSLSKGKKINLGQLLSHTAGLSVYGGFPGYKKGDKIPILPQVLNGESPANTPPVRSLFEPGLQFQYSGGGILISQLIITDLTGRSYESFMSDKVLQPLGMVQSFFSQEPPSGSRVKNIATPYTKNGQEVASRFNIYPEQSAMGLWTTPSELSKYMIGTQLAYAGRISKVLNREMAQRHLTPYIDQSATMGAFIGLRNGEKYFFHDAGNEGFRGLFYGSVEGGNGLVVFVNSDNGDIILELLNSVAAVYNWKGFDKPASVHTVTIADSIARKYTGVYVYDGVIAEVTKKKGGLYYWTEGQDVKMYFTTERDFVNIEFLADKSFTSDASGKVNGYSRTLNGKIFNPARKVESLDSIQTNPGQLSNYGWHLLETKRFDAAVIYLKRAAELAPDDTNASLNLAHALLFNKDFEKAIEIYKTTLGSKPEEVRKTISQDFAFFSENGFDNTVMEKAAAALIFQP